jgi:hypothetical protein
MASIVSTIRFDDERRRVYYAIANRNGPSLPVDIRPYP